MTEQALLTQWVPDVLVGFEQAIIPLVPDEDPPTLATLVRLEDEHQSEDPTFALLHLHGWNDYFHQVELAHQVARLAGAFFALDLRRYGRSIRPGHPRGYVEDLSTYDEEIGRSLAHIRAAYPGIPVVLMGHSTGGLVATRWAQRHPGQLAGLLLNSPWLDSGTGQVGRTLLHGLIEAFNSMSPRSEYKLAIPPDYQELSGPWQDKWGEKPAWAKDFPRDPALLGWDFIEGYSTTSYMTARPGWARAIAVAQSELAGAPSIDCPIFLAHSHASATADANDVRTRYADAVLDVDSMVQRGIELGDEVTLLRLRCPHDVTMADPPERERFYRAMAGWLDSLVFARPAYTPLFIEAESSSPLLTTGNS
ncbi:MAG: alpha/beta fold hydrolase [Buchananella hordeovulneris]|nr:alpha/beta fold hydrolase [Buchananella hordeovulneris]